MNKQAIIALILGLLLGAGGVFAANQTTPSNLQTATQITPTSTPESHSIDHSPHSMDQMSMGEMTAELQGKTGDEFDRVFIQAMIGHHQGAIDMAKMAKTQAKHDEIKQMSDAIISAQQAEITQMQDWQKAWGY